jgi:hypothetical protein
MLNNKIKKKISFNKNQANPNEPFKSGLRFQTCNQLNPRFLMNQETLFKKKLMLIRQSKYNKEQPIKRLKKTRFIFKLVKNPTKTKKKKKPNILLNKY